MQSRVGDAGSNFEKLGLSLRNIRGGLCFLKCIRKEGLELGEELQDYNLRGIWKILNEVSSSVAWSSQQFRLPHKECYWASNKESYTFLPRSGWLYENIPSMPLREATNADRPMLDAAKMLLYCSWARFILNGGKVLSRVDMEGIRDEIIQLCKGPPASEANFLVRAFDDLQFIDQLAIECGAHIPSKDPPLNSPAGHQLGVENFLGTMRVLAVAPVLTATKAKSTVLCERRASLCIASWRSGTFTTG